MHYFKITLLAAAMAAFSLTPAFPAFADEPVGTDVTVVEAGTSDTSEDSVQDVQESQETSGSRESKGHRASVVGEEEYISQGPGIQKRREGGSSGPQGDIPWTVYHHRNTAAANSAPAVIALPIPARFPPQTTPFPLI